MKRLTVIALALLVVTVISGFSGCQYQTTITPTAENIIQSTSSNTGQTTTSQITFQEISIENFTFLPASLTIRQGTAVTWANKDTAAQIIHQVVADDFSFQTGDILPGQKTSLNFDKIGTFNYHCGIHPSMHGTIIVTK